MSVVDNIDQWFQLPPLMDRFIREQVEYGMFASKTDYWKYLIRELMLGNNIKAFTKNELPKPNKRTPHTNK